MVSIPVTCAPAEPAAAATAALPGVGGASPATGAGPLVLDFSALLAALLGGETPDANPADGAAVADDGDDATRPDAAAADLVGAGAVAATAAIAVPAPPAVAGPGDTEAAPAPEATVPASGSRVAPATVAVAASPGPAAAVAGVESPPAVAPERVADAAPEGVAAGAVASRDPETPEAATPENPDRARAAASTPRSAATPEGGDAGPRATQGDLPPDDTTTTAQATRIAAGPQATAAEAPRAARHGDVPAHPAPQVAAADRIDAPAPGAAHAQTGGESTPEHAPDGKGTPEHAAGDVPAELRDAAAPAGPAPARHGEPTPQQGSSAHATAPARDVPRDAPAPPATHPARDVEQLVRLDALRPLRVADGGDMRLEVHRADLGQIDVHVSVRNDGVNATLLADQAGAREALTAQRPALEAALGRANLRLDGFSVGVGQQQHQPPQPDPHQQQTAPPSGWRPEPAVVTSPVASAEPVRTWAGGLSLRA